MTPIVSDTIDLLISNRQGRTNMNDIAARRSQYIQHFMDTYDPSSIEDQYDDKLWAINHCRLVLGRDADGANEYFESVSLDPRPQEWIDGMDTKDWDFPATKLLKTLLDFQHSPLLSDRAKDHLTSIFTSWDPPRKSWNKNNDHVAQWPVIHTENHDLMCLTIRLFGEMLAGRDCAHHIRQVSQSLSWLFERGWVEWNSPCYQIHYLNPLLILAEHAPDESLRIGARNLINLQLAERALLSVNGYLGGPYFRGYEQHLCNDRCDSYLPVMWLALGFSEVRADDHEGLMFATSTFEPHPIVRALATDAATSPTLSYRGSRPIGPPVGWDLKQWRVTYYNTPHISMGSKTGFDFSFQPRFFNVMFGADPSKNLRTDLMERNPELAAGSDDTLEPKGEVAQYENWLIARGKLVAEGQLKPHETGKWDLYRVGKGLCAHVELPGDLHVFQVSDLDLYSSEDEFVAALIVPILDGNMVRGRTIEGEDIFVSLAGMSISVRGRPDENWREMLHDCPAMRSRFGSGVIDITTSQGDLVIDNSELRSVLDQRSS